MRRLAPLMMLALTACPPEDDEEPFDLALDADDAEGYVVEASGGPTPHEVLVRAVNSYGAAVGASSASFTVGTSARTVTFDAFGYGSFSVETPGGYAVTGAQSEGVSVYGTDADFAGLGFSVGAEQRDDPRAVVPVSDGVLLVGNTQVWWMAPGERPHPVLTMNDAIGGVFPCQLDFDGVTDAVVWGGSTVALLKGRSDGGMAWGGGFTEASSKAVGAAACGDVTGDLVGDVVIGWSDTQGDPEVMVLEGDGLWTFDLYESLWIEENPTSITVGDNAATNRGQISVFTDGASLVRYAVNDSGTIYATGPTFNTTTFPDGAELLPPFDLDGDGAPELVLVGPFQELDQRVIQVWDLSSATPLRYSINRDEGMVSYGDLNGDGLTDLLTLNQDLQLSALMYDGEELIQHYVGEPPTHGLIGVVAQGSGQPADFLLADADRWLWWGGRLTESTNDLEEVYDQYRTTAEEGTEIAGGFATGVVAPAELDGSATSAEWVHADANVLTVSSVDGSGTVSTLGSTTLSDESFVEVVVCDRTAWVLGDSTLTRVALDGLSTSETAVSGGLALSCQSDEVAVLTSSEVQRYDDGLVLTDSSDSSGALDLALVRYDGASSEVVTCTAAACGLATVHNADGTQVVVEGTNRSLAMTNAAGTTELSGSGVPWAADVDGDGNEDVVVLMDDAVIAVHLNAGGELAPGWIYHRGEGASAGPVWAMDYDGDGSRDLAVHDGAGSWWVSPAPSVDAPGDTGDTEDTESTDTESTDTEATDTETSATDTEAGGDSGR